MSNRIIREERMWGMRVWYWVTYLFYMVCCLVTAFIFTFVPSKDYRQENPKKYFILAIISPTVVSPIAISGVHIFHNRFKINQRRWRIGYHFLIIALSGFLSSLFAWNSYSQLLYGFLACAMISNFKYHSIRLKDHRFLKLSTVMHVQVLSFFVGYSIPALLKKDPVSLLAFLVPSLLGFIVNRTNVCSSGGLRRRREQCRLMGALTPTDEEHNLNVNRPVGDNKVVERAMDDYEGKGSQACWQLEGL